MKYLIALVSTLCVVLAYPSGGHHHYNDYPIHPGVGAIYKGPNSETIIEGPDGSVITSEQDAGAVVIEPQLPGRVLHNTKPIITPDFPLSPDPILLANVVKPILPPLAVIPPTVHLDPIVVVEDDPKIVNEHVLVGDKIIAVPRKVEEDSDLVGPSGTISIRGGDAVIAGPASTTIKGKGVVAEIQKQDDVQLKTIEVKPVVAPVVLPKIDDVAPIVTPIVAQPLSLTPIISSTKIVTPDVAHHAIVTPNVAHHAIVTQDVSHGIVTQDVAHHAIVSPHRIVSQGAIHPIVSPTHSIVSPLVAHHNTYPIVSQPSHILQHSIVSQPNSVDLTVFPNQDGLLASHYAQPLPPPQLTLKPIYKAPYLR